MKGERHPPCSWELESNPGHSSERPTCYHDAIKLIPSTHIAPEVRMTCAIPIVMALGTIFPMFVEFSNMDNVISDAQEKTVSVNTYGSRV